jgi:hypothetical protein
LIFSSLLSFFAELSGYAGAFIEFAFPCFLLAIISMIYKHRKILTKKRRGKFYLPTFTPEKEPKTKNKSSAPNVLDAGNETVV